MYINRGSTVFRKSQDKKILLNLLSISIISYNLFQCREVFKAKDRRTGRVVALKKILMENEKEGFPITALREIRILKLLKHENVVNLQEICRTKGKY